MPPCTLVSGGTGFVGRFIVEALLAAGHGVRVMGRTPPPAGFFSGAVEFVEGSLDRPTPDPAIFEGVDGFVHAGFHHIAARFRGGEGDDPEGFRRCNLDGTLALFSAAREAGVRRCVFLSSRAVYGRQSPGALLAEDMEPHPDTLYGEVKLGGELALRELSDPDRFCGTSLRVTGVYGPAGPGREHKWSALFRDFSAGTPIPPRVATEVHGEDVAGAVRLVLAAPPEDVCGKLFNVSDLVLDRHDLLSMVRDVTGVASSLPERADATSLNVMATERLTALGWRPGGNDRLRSTVADLCRPLQGGHAMRNVASGEPGDRTGG
ncbi:NAD(P)-dependent oxidoreductase [Aquibium sp. LZ166]|uniref:NAD(P)-dependent oxidoreductase n=1 Tax=Aquibium pacificus TaxID=3153579 RepID=A0ABV3SGL8_9HYPH